MRSGRGSFGTSGTLARPVERAVLAEVAVCPLFSIVSAYSTDGMLGGAIRGRLRAFGLGVRYCALRCQFKNQLATVASVRKRAR
jgi:hypothetical protein